MSTVELLNPNGRNPERTHSFDLDEEVYISVDIADPDRGTDIVCAVVVDRGYTRPSDRPVYVLVTDENLEYSRIETNVRGNHPKE